MCSRILLVALALMISGSVDLAAEDHRSGSDSPYCQRTLFFRQTVSFPDKDSLWMLTGIVYDTLFRPVPATHVINICSGAGDVTDHLGIFRLPVTLKDTLFFRNIAYRDTLVPAASFYGRKYIRIREKYYSLQEAKIFQWGSTYEDFREAVVGMPEVQSLGERLDLPRQDPGYIPYHLNEEKVKSVGFLITSPVSFLYHNLSRRERSARKLFRMNRNRKEKKAFEEILSRSNISHITGLTGHELERFLRFLNERIICDFRCSELEIYTEIHSLWDLYLEISSE